MRFSTYINMIEDRIKILNQIEQKRKSKVILYVTYDRKGLETSI